MQTKIVHYISEEYSGLTGYDISIQRIAIDWFDEIAIKGVRVIDPEENTLLYAEDVKINFKVEAILNNDDHNIDNVIIDKAHIYLTKITVDDSVTTLNINELVRRIKAGVSKKKKEEQVLSVDHLSIRNTTFSYNDQERDSIETGFDYYHFTLDNINGEFDQLQSVADVLDLQVVSLTANERSSHLDINQFTSSFTVSQTHMAFRNLNLQAGNSIIRDTVIFNYSSTRDLSDFNTKIDIKANLDQTILHSKDLALFAPALKGFDEFYQLTGDFDGKVNAFTLDNALLKFGKGTLLKGKIRMTGLPDFQETFINFDLLDSYVRIQDLQYYIKEKTYNHLKPFESIGFNAEFLGFPNDFVAKGDFLTGFGRITSDINLKLEENINKSTYSGNLNMHNFDLGGYMQNAKFGNVTVWGEIVGTGFTLEDANFDLKGQIKKIDINNYVYTNIQTDAQFAKEFFKGYLSVDDPNLRLTTTGSIDLRKGMNLFNIKADLDTAFLKPLNFTKEEIFIRSEIDVNARGLKMDSLIGLASLRNTFISYNEKELELDTLSIMSSKKANERHLLLESNLLDLRIEGAFDYSVVYKDLKTLLHEYRLNIQNERAALNSYYAQKDKSQYNDYALNYSLHVKDPNPIFSLFAPDLFVSKETFITGNFVGGYTSIVSMETHMDKLTYKDHLFFDNEVQLNISKVSDNSNVLAMAYIASDRQTIGGIDTKDLMLEGIWNNMHIDFEFDIDQVLYGNYARLFGSIDFLPNQTLLRLQPSDLQLLNKKWNIEKNNSISIIGNEITVDQIRVFNGTESVSLNGKISEDPKEKLILNIDSLNLENFNTLISKDISGTLDGYADVGGYYNDLQVQNEITITELTIDEFLIGDIEGTNLWNNVLKQFEVNFLVNRKKSAILEINGTYAPSKKENPLNLKANLNKTELNIIEPFINTRFSRLKGTASGELDISGTPLQPTVKGKGTIDKGFVHINYLGTSYAVEGDFYFKNDEIGFKEMQITDRRNNSGFLSGRVTHDSFKDFYIDIGGTLSNILVLNTSSTDNDLFYGTGIASGTINLVGPVNNMNIIAQAKTEKGTRIFIPIGDTESIEREEYINFVNFRDTTDAIDITKVSKIDLKGLKLDFDLNITPDAYCEIIFDIKAGDIIRGRGSGDIKLQIDTKGDFNMFGDYNIQEGGYNFTLYSIINKEFDILPNSKISWYGDPYQGMLDINATYNQLAAFSPLLVHQEADKVYEDVVELKRKYPVKVLLDIDGPLLSPAVNFDIVSNNLPRNIKVAERPDVDLEFEFLKFKNSIDEQELKRQVFSLIVLRRFSPQQSFNTGGSITSSVSELLSNQLSYWITQVDENLEIDFDLDFDQMDEDAYNTFQLRLSYTFLDGRLRVTRDGGFTNQKTDISSVAGDWTLEYLLTQDGKFKAKMYNRTNYNPINPTEENQNTITTGFSILHTQSFNELNELFQKKKTEIDTDEDEEDPGEQDEKTQIVNSNAVLEENENE